MQPKPGSQCRWSTHGRVVISPIPGSYRALSFRTLYGLLSEVPQYGFARAWPTYRPIRPSDDPKWARVDLHQHSAESLGPRTLCTVDVGLHSAHRAQPLRQPLGHCSLQRGDRPTVHLLRPTTWQTIYASSKVFPHVAQRNRTHNLSDGAQPPLKATQ
ncbi:hypothetical protein BDZ97DRAFT_1855051 [Flammula alnicola]|nr:hypothetical protein BDZ97DRAFT_1855051 [Flammula alnicola]